VLVHRKAAADPATADVTIKLDNAFRLIRAAMGDVSAPGLEISGDQNALQQLLGALDPPDPAFNIVTP
jgi:alkyl sulfatase BDS1-like metallo-beta-lactamase superfamily hydrolase